jgi:hypothetical protein
MCQICARFVPGSPNQLLLWSLGTVSGNTCQSIGTHLTFPGRKTILKFGYLYLYDWLRIDHVSLFIEEIGLRGPRL